MQDIAQEFLNLLPNLLGFAAMIAFVLGFLWGLYRLLLANRTDLNANSRLPRQIALLVFGVVGLVLITLALPVSESTRNQVLGLIGVLLSGLIAFSSTTIVGNLMAGLMMRFTKPFRIGDFVKVNSIFGRVTEQGLLDTEIQTEQSELISIPNSYLISHPITTTRSAGTFISANLSLGFDVHHRVIEPLLLEATKRTELEDGFVQIMEIGDFSVTYRVSGLLKEIKSLISARSKLMGNVLDCLHEADIEILSPSFMAQRPQPEGSVMIHKAPDRPTKTAQPEDQPETVVFNKAEKAQEIEQQVQTLKDELVAQEENLTQAETDDKKAIQLRIQTIKDQIKRVQENLHQQDD